MLTASPKPGFARSRETLIARFTLVGILLHLVLKYLLHFSALQSGLGGTAARLSGTLVDLFGELPPIWGAMGQELIELLAVLNAARVALPTDDLQGF